MNRITISFSRDWLNEQRKKNNRVIRLLEKWIASIGYVTVKSSSAFSLNIELAPADREQFITALTEYITVNFNEPEPLKFIKFSDDVSCPDVPTEPEQEEKSAGKDESPEESKPETTRKSSADTASESAVPEKKTENKEVSEAPQKPDPAQTVGEICGRVPIKYSRELETYVRETAEVIPMLQKMGSEATLWHQHLLLAVDAGYGRSEFLRSMVELYKTFGLIQNELDKKSVREFILLPVGSENRADGYHVTWDGVLEAAQEMNRTNTRNGISKVIIYIDISTWQDRLDSVEGKARLRRLNSLCGTFLVVFRVPFVEGHILRKTAEALNDILNVRTIAVPPAPVEAMIDYARTELSKSGFELSDNALAPFEQFLLHEKVDNSFFGYKTMNKVVQKMIYDKALSNCRRKVEERIIDTGDFEFLPSYSGEPDDKPVDELKKMVGMEAVAQRLREVIVQIKTQKRLAAKGKKVASPAIHMLFTGNPGTDKTTVARILARMMHQAGILRKGHLVEVKGRDLCGQYIGETAPKTSAICRDAYGSVLFIDEAYSLFRDEYSSSRDFGREALDTLVAEMDNHRDDMCVIMAGYKDEMDAMLKGNAGLKGRIPYEIEFRNYTRAELEKIFFTMLDGVFDYEDELKNAVHEFFADIPEETFNSKVFSNARLVRNLYERTWGKAAYRQSLEGGELRILKNDLVGAMADNEFKNLMKKTTERTVIGFGSQAK